MTAKEKIAPKFGIKDQIGYVFGDMAGSFVNLFVDSYFLTFCTYALGIEPAWMATLFLFSRLWDAVNDPIIGSFPDRWKLGKSGDKFKPWVKLFMIPLALSGVLCFSKVPFEGIMLHVWVAVVYIDRLFFATDMYSAEMEFPLGAWLDEQVEKGTLSRETYEKICFRNAKSVFGL